MLARIYKTVLCFFASLILVACERDNDLVFPKPTTKQAEPFCLDGSPYQSPSVIDNIRLEGIDYLFNYTDHEYSLSVQYLVDQIGISVSAVSQFYTPNLKESLTVSSSDGGALLSSSQIDRLLRNEAELVDTSIMLSYEVANETREFELKAGQGFTDLTLDPGVTEINVTVEVEMIAPFSGVECSLDETVRSLIADHDAGNISEESTAALDSLNDEENTITEEVSYRYVITRNEVDSIQVTSFDNVLGLYSHGQIDSNSISVTDNYLAIGVPSEDSSSSGVYSAIEREADADNSIVNSLAADSGSVYLYEKNSAGEWRFAWMFKSMNTDAGDLFGHSVSVVDGWLAVSAPGEDSANGGIYTSYSSNGVYDPTLAQVMSNSGNNDLAPDSGAVYLYRMDDKGAWALNSYIKPHLNVRSGSGYNIGFGDSVILESSLTSQKKLIISAPLEDSSDGEFGATDSLNSGAVYLYDIEASTGSVTYDMVLKAPTPDEGDRFGSSVDISTNGRIYVGAPFEDSSNSDVTSESSEEYVHNTLSPRSGAVFEFYPVSDGDLYVSGEVIKASNADSDDLFGSDLSVSGNSIAVSAPKEDGGSVGFNRNMNSNESVDSGAVYLFQRNELSNRVFQELYIKGPANEEVSSFGNALIHSANKLVISHSRYQGSSAEEAGAIYTYLKSSITQEWTRILDTSFEGSVELGTAIGFDRDSVIATNNNADNPLVLVR
jgi:hypothetical protein